jgi:Ran GTPase-activating protein (RanGAP) involved in mRNA processing and transport
MNNPNNDDATNNALREFCNKEIALREFCNQVRNNDPSILPESGRPFRIQRRLNERGVTELARALLENRNVTDLHFGTAKYTERSAMAMAMFLHTSERLQRIVWHGAMLDSWILPAFQESTSLKELDMELPPVLSRRLSNLALENLLTNTQSLRSLTLRYPNGLQQDADVAAVSSGLSENTTLRELTLIFRRAVTTNLSTIFTSLSEHPHLRRLCLHRFGVDMTGLEVLLASKTSKITELDLLRYHGGPPAVGLMLVLEALARRPTLTKLELDGFPLGVDEVGQLMIVLYNTPSLQALVLKRRTLGIAGLVELAQALCHKNTSIKVLDLSENGLGGRESAEIFRDILRSNKTITSLALNGNKFGEANGAVACIAFGMGSNSTLLKIDLSDCALGDEGLSSLVRIFGSSNTTLQRLALRTNLVTSTGVGVLLDTIETIEYNSNLTDLDLNFNRIGNGGASRLARSLGSNARPSLTRLSLTNCDIEDDGFIALVSALGQNISLLHLDLQSNPNFSERAILALADILPASTVLQGVRFSHCSGLAPNMPLLLAGLRQNTSLFRFHLLHCALCIVPPTPEQRA